MWEDTEKSCTIKPWKIFEKLQFLSLIALLVLALYQSVILIDSDTLKYQFEYRVSQKKMPDILATLIMN